MASTADVLTAVQFQDELRRVARFDTPRRVEHALVDALQKIVQNPAYNQSRLLTRILTALTYQSGVFRRAEASALDSATLAIVIALMDAQRAGTMKREEWISAVDTANAAQLESGG
jgi:hypothetical protein